MIILGPEYIDDVSSCSNPLSHTPVSFTEHMHSKSNMTSFCKTFADSHKDVTSFVFWKTTESGGCRKDCSHVFKHESKQQCSALKKPGNMGEYGACVEKLRHEKSQCLSACKKQGHEKTSGASLSGHSLHGHHKGHHNHTESELSQFL